MVPERLKRAIISGNEAAIYPLADRVAVERTIDGTCERLVEAIALEDFDTDNWAELEELTQDCRLRVILQPPHIFVNRLRLPNAARSRLRQAVALQLPQLVPLEPDCLTWAVQITGIFGGEIEVELAMARTAHMAALQARFEAAGARVPPFYAETSFGFLLLENGEAGARQHGAGLTRKAWIAAALLILSVPVTTLIAAGLMTASLNSEAQSLEQELAPKIAAERQARQLAATRVALAPVAAVPLASDALEEVAVRLPETSYAETVAQGLDRSLHIVVKAADTKAATVALAASEQLPRISLADQTADASGRMVATFRSDPR